MRRLPAGLLAFVVLLLTVGPAGPAAAQDGDRERRVLIVSAPRLTWRTVVEHQPPALLELLGRSAVAVMSPRTIGGRTTSGEGYATIGAGNRSAAPETAAGDAFAPNEPFEGTTAGEVFTRRTLLEPRAAVVHLGIAPVVRANLSLLYGAKAGAMGAVLREAGIPAAVVANADVPDASGAVVNQREAALAVMDRRGRVRGGAVSDELVAEDRRAPYGIRQDVDATVDAFEAAWADGGVVLVELSDLDRVDRYAGFASADARDRLLGDAMQRADEILERLLDDVDPDRDVVVVVAPAAPRAGEEPTVFGIAGPGIETGQARSATTRRPGFVTLADVGPTILRALDLDVPTAMTGNRITSAGGRPPDAGLYDDLADRGEVARFRDGAVGPVAVTFVVFEIVTFALAALGLATTRRRLRPVAGFLALVGLGVPILVFLSALTPYDSLGRAGYVVALFAVATAGAVAALGVGRLVAARTAVPAAVVAPLLVVAATWLVLVTDAVTGGRLQMNTVFGYSAIVGGRFAGLGNQAFALLAVSAVLLATGLWALPRFGGDGDDESTTGPAWLVAAGLVLAATVVVDGHPAFGADVGGVLATVPAFAVVVLLLAGGRVGWRRLLLVGGATVGLLVVFAAIDLSRPEESRTHLGRLVDRALGGDGQSLPDVLQRKVNANLHLLTTSVWTLLVPVALGLLAYFVWRRPSALRQAEADVPGLRAAVVGSLVAAGLGFALNDSGIVVPAMILAVLVPYLTHLVVRPEVQ